MSAYKFKFKFKGPSADEIAKAIEAMSRVGTTMKAAGEAFAKGMTSLKHAPELLVRGIQTRAAKNSRAYKAAVDMDSAKFHYYQNDSEHRYKKWRRLLSNLPDTDEASFDARTQGGKYDK